MIPVIQLRYLKYLLGEVSTEKVLLDILKVGELNFFQKLYNKKKIENDFSKLISTVSNIKFDKLRSKKIGKLNLPLDLDGLGYSARLETEQLINILQKDKGKYLEVVATTIAIVCYSEYYKEPYEEGVKFRELRKYVLMQDILDCIGSFNLVIEELNKSNNLWGKKFGESQTEDPDFLLAGGYRLQNFNTISVIETICKKFNISIDKAWKQPFSVVQTALLRQSIQDDIQAKMAKIKQAKMKSKK